MSWNDRKVTPQSPKENFCFALRIQSVNDTEVKLTAYFHPEVYARIMQLDFFTEDECVAIIAKMEEEFNFFWAQMAELMPGYFGVDNNNDILEDLPIARPKDKLH